MNVCCKRWQEHTICKSKWYITIIIGIHNILLNKILYWTLVLFDKIVWLTFLTWNYTMQANTDFTLSVPMKKTVPSTNVCISQTTKLTGLRIVLCFFLMINVFSSAVRELLLFTFFTSFSSWFSRRPTSWWCWLRVPNHSSSHSSVTRCSSRTNSCTSDIILVRNIEDHVRVTMDQMHEAKA